MMGEYMSDVLHSLKKISEIIVRYKSENERSALYNANAFNPFRFMRTDENGLSGIIAFLLDPKQSHGQGDIFLNSFLKKLGLFHFLAYNKVVVTVEKSTSGKRRHDIFIEGYLDQKRTWIISIENKLRGASDQPNQLGDYCDDLSKYNVPYFLIYLPIYEQSPTSLSIEDKVWQSLVGENKAKCLSARWLIDWLDKTALFAPSIISFCSDFKRFLREGIMNINTGSNELISKIIDNNELLNSALTVIDLSEELYQRLLDMLEEQLKDKIYSKYPKLVEKGWAISNANHFTNRYFGIYFDIKSSKYGVGFEFDSKWLQDCYYGVYVHQDEISRKYYNKLQGVFSHLYSGFKTNSYWLMYKYFDNDLRNWDANILSQIPTGELAEQLFNYLEPFIDVIEKNIELFEE